MTKVGCVAFHASHNYGSVLLPYALQEYIKENFPEIEFEFINLRTEAQKRMYKFPPDSLKRKIALLFHKKALKKKYDKFELFINNILHVSEEYKTEDDVKQKYDIYLAAGDQIWNPNCRDFSWFYYFEGVKNGKKCSYCPSMGPDGIIPENLKHHISDLLMQFDVIGVREEGTQKAIENLINGKDTKIMPDPSLLVSKEKYEDLIKNCNDIIKINKPYILFYNLKPNKQSYLYAKEIGKILNKKIIVTRPSNKRDYFGYYENHFDTGPIDFLSLLKKADAVISTSFHGCVFSSIFHKPFIALDGENDNRISAFLKRFGLTQHLVNSSNATRDDIIKVIGENDFSKFENVLVDERKKAYNFFSEIFRSCQKFQS